MAASSKYIQLSSSVLLEYRYSDQDLINTPGNQYRISTDVAPIWKLSNGHNGKDQILNSDNSEFIQDELPIGTGNVRNRSFAIIDPFKSALLDINKITFYNDFDPLLTNTQDLPIEFDNVQAPVYDTVRLHLVQGFNFEDNDGLVLSIKAKKKDQSEIILANLVYNRKDSWEVLNPSPFIFGGRVYSSYIEIRVLSLYNLILDYWLGTLTGDTVVERITDGNGVLRNQQIKINFGFINTRETIDSQEYITLIDTKSIDIKVRDPFETISGFVSESSSGDYIEYYATHDGSIIQNYILDLNNSGGDYIILHDLNVFEYVFNPDTQEYFWTQTDTIESIQTGNFDRPNFFRPIIRNSSAIAYRIDYIVRLYNREDNSQVWKTVSMTSFNAAKFGRVLSRINLGENPVQSKIYNQKVIKDIQLNKINPPVLSNIKYVTSLSNNSNISISSQSINEIEGVETDTLITLDKSIQKSSGKDLKIYGNGLGKILIPDSTVFLKFNLYQKINGQNKLMNLSGLGKLQLSFISDQGEYITFEQYPNEYTSSSNGEVIFRISEGNSNRILKLNDRTFKIHLLNESGDKTFLYVGTFMSIEEFIEDQKNSTISLLEKTIEELTNELLSITELNEAQQLTVSKLITENKKLNTTLSGSVDDQSVIAAQQEVNQKFSDIIEELESSVRETSNTIKGQVNKISDELGIPVKDINLKGDPNEKSQSAAEKSIAGNKGSVKGDDANNMKG